MTARRWTTVCVALGLSMVAALAGCGAGEPSTAQGATQAPASNATQGVLPTAQPSPTVSSAGPGTPRPCAASAGAVVAGDLAITPPTVMYGFNADYKLPDGLPMDKPLVVTVQQNEPYVQGAALESGPVIQGAFVITVCNTSSTRAHKLTSYGVMLASLTPYSGKISALNGCAFLYSRPTGYGGGCDSGYQPDVEQSYQLPGSATPGAKVTDLATGATTLPPGEGLDVAFDISSPSSPAVATYRLGVGVDGAAAVYSACLRTQPRLVAPIATHWAGTYCTTAQMQAQIPASPPANTYYACPQV